MSLTAYRAVTIGSLAKGGPEQAVLQCLADHAIDDGTSAFPSNGTISDETKLAERTVRNALRRLEERRAIAYTGESQFRTATYRVFWRDVDEDVADWLEQHSQELADGETPGSLNRRIGGQLRLSERGVRKARRRLAQGKANPTAGGCRCFAPNPAGGAGGRNDTGGTSCRHPRHDVPLGAALDAPKPSENDPRSNSGVCARTREATDKLASRVYKAALKNGYDDVLEQDELHEIQTALDEFVPVNGSHQQAVEDVERYSMSTPRATWHPLSGSTSSCASHSSGTRSWQPANQDSAYEPSIAFATRSRARRATPSRPPRSDADRLRRARRRRSRATNQTSRGTRRRAARERASDRLSPRAQRHGALCARDRGR